MRRVLVPILWIGLAALPGAATDVPDHPLTLKEAIELLRTRNPALLSGRAHLQAVQAGEISANLRPNPVFTSANEDFRVFDPSTIDISHAQEFTNSISQMIERGHKRQRRLEDAALTTRVAGDTYRDSKRQLEFQLKSAFVGLLLAKANLQLAQGNAGDYRQTVELNQVRLKAGDISGTEFDRIALEQARFESDLLAAETSVAQAREQLQALLGIEPTSPGFDIQGTLEVPELSQTLPELQRAALASRPDYLGARHAVEKAKADVRLADANGATDLNLGGEYKRNGPDNTMGFTLSFPLRVFDRNQGEKLRARRELEAAQHNEQAVRLQVDAEVAQAWAAYRGARSEALLYSSDYLRRAQSVRTNTEFSFRHGGAGLLDYLDAVRSYREVELAARAANAQLMLAIHQLSFATSTELMP